MAFPANPRPEKTNKSYHALMDAAMELIFERGINVVTIDDICVRCGVTKGTFYHNFSSKDHIVTLAINTRLDEYISSRFVPEETASLQKQLSGLLMCGFGFFKSLGKSITQQAYEALVRSGIDVRIKDRAFVDFLTAIVRRGLAENAFAMGLDAYSTYSMIIAVYSGILIKWSMQSDQTGLVLDWEHILQRQIQMMIPNR